MDKIKINCPKCGFSKEFPAESVPKVPFRINCPKCKEASVIRPGAPEPAPVAPARPPRPEAPVSAPAAPEPPMTKPPTPEPPAPEPAVSPAEPHLSSEAGMVKIVCPGCGFRKEVKAGLVPEGAAITCPQCKERFFFSSGTSDEPREDNAAGMHAAGRETPTADRLSTSYAPRKPVAPQPRTPVKAPEARVGAGGSLPGVGELFGRTWEVYKGRFWTILGLYLTSVLFCILPVGIFYGAGALASRLLPAAKPALTASSLAVGIIAGFIGLSFGFAALFTAVVDSDVDYAEALSIGQEKFLSFAWLFMLMFLVVLGGYVLLIIPGLLLSVWFIFAQYILADEETYGMDALIKSREYGKGYWWGLFLRFLAVWLVSAVMNVIPLVGGILSLAFMPFTFIYINMNYQALKEIKGEIKLKPAGNERQAMTGLGILGAVALVLLMSFLAYKSF